jgi:hypothetical protein
MEAQSRRAQRDSERATVLRGRAQQRWQRELQRRQREIDKEDERMRALAQVERFESYLEILVSVHKDCGPPWDWTSFAEAAPPPAPTRGSQHEFVANEALRTYKSGFFDRLFGSDKKRIAQLQQDVIKGRAVDQEAHEVALREYKTAHDAWNVRKDIGGRLLAGDASAYKEALDHAAVFEALLSFQTRVNVTDSQPEVVALACEVKDEELIPKEEVKLTSSGKLTTKAMPSGRYWALYQDHVCSCALRVAGECFAVLPVSRVIVNIGAVQLSTITGHRELVTMLAVHFVRDAWLRVNLDQIDPSDSMKNFSHRMRFKKTSGFEPVTPITPDEQWVTT